MTSYLKTAVAPVITAIVMASLSAGCSTAWYGGAPEPSFDVNKDLERLAQEFKPADSITDFYKNPNVDLRNKFITGRVTLMNIRYIQFVRKLTSERQLLDSAVAMLTIGLNLAGTTAGSAGTKTILAAIAAGVTGSKEVIDKNYFFEKTIPALVAQMNADRKKALIPLLEGMKGTLDDYSFAQAVTDLHSYYFAGTFTGAIQTIQADAGVKENKADLDISKLRKSRFFEDETTMQLRTWLFDADLKPREENAKKLREWMDNSQLKSLATEKFLDNPDLGDLRKKAISELKIPKTNP